MARSGTSPTHDRLGRVSDARHEDSPARSSTRFDELLENGTTYLARLAAARDHIDLAEFNDWVCDNEFDLTSKEGRAALAVLLTEISRRSVQADGIMLGTLVHRPGERLDVGDEIYTLATQLMRFNGATNPVVRRMYVGREVEDVYTHFGAPAGQHSPSTWRDSDPDTKVAPNVAIGEWAAALSPVLEQVAADYGAYLTVDELAERLFTATGVRTRTVPGRWMSRVLGPIHRATVTSNAPPFASLVVRATGGVGPSYTNHAHPHGFDNEYDRQWAAAADRLACYRHVGAELPADARPALTELYLRHRGEPARPQPSEPTRPQRRTAARPARGEQAATARPAASTRSVKVEPAPPKLCPRCFTVLPLSGQCDTCD